MKFVVVSSIVAVMATIATAQEPARDPASRASSVGVEWEHENFDDTLDPWNVVTVDVGQRFSALSVIGRVHLANRFDQDGTQYELEMYPKFRKGTYAYLAAAVSSDDIFPDRRFGAQLYQNVGKGFELSIGARLLEFDDSDVKIYTGSIGRYSGNYYVVFSPTFADREDEEDMSSSGALLVRRYFATADDYIGLRLNAGEVPETDILLQTVRLDSWSARFEGQRGFGNGFLFKGALGYRDQDLLFDRERASVIASVGLRKRF